MIAFTCCSDEEEILFRKKIISRRNVNILRENNVKNVNISRDANVNSVPPNNEEKIPSKKTRKRKRDPSQWASNVRKQKRNNGQSYISSRRKLVPSKVVKNLKNCLTACRLKCSQQISDAERNNIFQAYYNLSRDSKRLFLLAHCKKIVPNRRRKDKNEVNSRKKYTFQFFFEVNAKKVQVCKNFFLGTLSVSQKTIYNVHETKNISGNTPRVTLQGRHTKHIISEEAKNAVRDHIKSIPKIDSHYCRAHTQREYVESTLNIRKMYELYKETMEEQNKEAVKESQYRFIFNTEFNIFFQVPKKDRCDICELVKLSSAENKNIENDLQEKYEKHITEKKACLALRTRDRESAGAVLSFDLQNVLTCPKAEISKFFYKSKLSVYNLTAHFSTDNQVYCSFWDEHLMGRKGCDLASALYRILLKVLEDHPDLEHLTLWSDSCVAQNRNSIMSFALAKLLWEKKDTRLEKITMKFSVPGHSAVQEVDAIHSAIERALRATEYYSPLSLIRLLLKVNRRKPYKILQMQRKNFKHFQECSSTLKYENVPFSKVTELHFGKSYLETVYFKTSYIQDSYIEAKIESSTFTGRVLARELRCSDRIVKLPQNKVDALKFMLPWMPQIDKEYYLAFLPQEENKNKKKRKK